MPHGHLSVKPLSASPHTHTHTHTLSEQTLAGHFELRSDTSFLFHPQPSELWAPHGDASVLNPHCHSSTVPLWSHGCVASVSQSYGANSYWCKTNRSPLSEACSISTGKEPRWQPHLCSFFHFKVKCIYFPLVNFHSVLCLWVLFRFVSLLGAGYERLQKVR